MLLRRLLLLPPSQVCVCNLDDTPFAFEADYQGQVTGVRSAPAPVAVIGRGAAGEAQPSRSEKHGAAVRFVALFLSVNAVALIDDFRASLICPKPWPLGISRRSQC